DSHRTQTLRRMAPVAAVAVVVLAVLALALSSRGLGGTVTHAWKRFTAPQAPSNVAPGRLLTTDSYRWLWWSEAARAFGDRPIRGWGAGSFGVIHLLYRHNTLPVEQPHSVPLQLMAETGIVGAVLAVTGFLLLLRAAASCARRRLSGSTRLLGGALLAGAVAYGVHSLYDWDWNIPAVTLPAFLFMGVLCGARRGASAPGITPRPSATARVLALGSLALWLCAFALSAALPSWAASKATSALV